MKQLDGTYNVGDHKDIVLVLGMADSDIITLTSLIAGAELESIKTVNGFRIVDKNRKTNEKNSTISKSDIPNLMLGAKNGVAYYVFPNFSNSKDIEAQVAAIFYLRQLLNSAKSVKFLITISYASLQNRQSAMDLALQLTNIILDIEKYRDSIPLVITKAPDADDLVSLTDLK